jgi:hypothetical protein
MKTFYLLLLAIFACLLSTRAQADSITLQTNFQAPATSPGTHAKGSSVGNPDRFDVLQGSVNAVTCGSQMANQCLQLTVVAGQIPSLYSEHTLALANTIST